MSDLREEIRRDRAATYKRIIGELVGGAVGLLFGAYVLLPQLGDGWLGILSALAAIVIGAIIGHNFMEDRL